MTPSQLHGTRENNPKRTLGDHYIVNAYGHAIADACKKAGVPHWHPHQLRHKRSPVRTCARTNTAGSLEENGPTASSRWGSMTTSPAPNLAIVFSIALFVTETLTFPIPEPRGHRNAVGRVGLFPWLVAAGRGHTLLVTQSSPSTSAGSWKPTAPAASPFWNWRHFETCRHDALS